MQQVAQPTEVTLQNTEKRVVGQSVQLADIFKVSLTQCAGTHLVCELLRHVVHRHQPNQEVNDDRHAEQHDYGVEQSFDDIFCHSI